MATSSTLFDQGITLIALLAIIMAIIAVILGGLMVWIALTFYRLAAQNLEESKQSAEVIKNSANRMESLFEKFYMNSFDQESRGSASKSKQSKSVEDPLPSEMGDASTSQHSIVSDTIINLVQRQTTITLSRLLGHPSLKRFQVTELEHEIQKLADEKLISIFGSFNRPDTVITPFDADQQDRSNERIQHAKQEASDKGEHS